MNTSLRKNLKNMALAFVISGFGMALNITTANAASCSINCAAGSCNVSGDNVNCTCGPDGVASCVKSVTTFSPSTPNRPRIDPDLFHKNIESQLQKELGLQSTK